MRRLTLPTDSNVRKDIPLYSGCYTYFPAALAGVAMHSKAGNDKHNPGEPLHHARGKSMDHADCIARHSMDLADMLARKVVWTAEEQAAILAESRALSWRSLAWAQEIEEMFGAPLAPAARLPKSKLAEQEIKAAVERAYAGEPTGWEPFVDYSRSPTVGYAKWPEGVPTDSPRLVKTANRYAHGAVERQTSKRAKSRACEADPEHLAPSDDLP